MMRMTATTIDSLWWLATGGKDNKSDTPTQMPSNPTTNARARIVRKTTPEFTNKNILCHHSSVHSRSISNNKNHFTSSPTSSSTWSSSSSSSSPTSKAFTQKYATSFLSSLNSIVFVLFILLSTFAITFTRADDSLETLDRFICLRPTGFFPHDVQCDHFYECRNSTIINEGICKSGLRFDYRYRKKPRCIASDLIDCRITQVDLDNGLIFTEDDPTTTTTSTTSTTTTSTTTTTTTERPTTSGFWTGSRPRNRNSHNRYNARARFLATTTSTTTTTTPAPSSEENVSNDSEETNDESIEVDSEPNENALTRRQKLTRKPLKLRRGSLQESSAAAHYSISSSALQSGLHHHHQFEPEHSQHLQHHQQQQQQPQHQPQSLRTSGRSISSAEDSDFLTGNRLTSHMDDALNNRRQVAVTSKAVTKAVIKAKASQCAAPNGYFADREDCRKFYACDDGRAFPMSCPLGLAYDELTGTCNWPDMVDGCRGEEMLRFTCPDPYESDVLDYGDPRYPTSDCRKFVVCVVSELYGSRTPRLLGCEEGLVFNPDSRSCDLPENVPQCTNYYIDRGYPSGYFRRAQLREGPRKRRLRH